MERREATNTPWLTWSSSNVDVVASLSTNERGLNYSLVADFTILGQIRHHVAIIGTTFECYRAFLPLAWHTW